MKLLKTVLLLAFVMSCTAFAQKDVKLKTANDSIAYCIGLNWGNMLKTDSLYFSLDAINKGMIDGISEGKPAISDSVIQVYIDLLNKKVSERRQRLQKEAAAVAGKTNAEQGKKFLDENKKNPNVKTTPSGLQYEVIREGNANGKMPKATDRVKVHYKGTLLNGKQFDSSYDRKEPATFGLNQVIKGWTEGVQLMKEGAKFKFYVPAELAYGERGASADIGPNSTLVFEVELLEVNPVETPAPGK